MTPLCDFPHSSSSSSVVAPTRRPPLRTAGATATSTSTARPGAAAAIFLVLLAIVVGRADACDIGLINSYNVTLHLVTYDDWDDTCVTPFNSYKVSKNGGDTPAECFSTTGCKVKLFEEGNDDSNDDAGYKPGCYGTVVVGCGQELVFYYDANGQQQNKIIGRRLVTEAEDAPPSSSSSLGGGGEGVAGSLRGGANGSKRII